MLFRNAVNVTAVDPPLPSLLCLRPMASATHETVMKSTLDPWLLWTTPTTIFVPHMGEIICTLCPMSIRVCIGSFMGSSNVQIVTVMQSTTGALYVVPRRYPATGPPLGEPLGGLDAVRAPSRGRPPSSTVYVGATLVLVTKRRDLSPRYTTFRGVLDQSTQQYP